MMRVARLVLLALTLCGVMLARCDLELVDNDPEVMLLQSRTARFAGISKAGAAVAPGRLDVKAHSADIMDEDLTAEDEQDEQYDHDDHDEHDDQDDHEDHEEHDSGHHEDDMARIMRVARIADTNKDDKLSAEELRSFAESLRARGREDQTELSLQSVDTDDSGDVTLDELRGDLSHAMAAHQEARFGAADGDNDGRLDPEEFHRFVHPEVDDDVLLVERAHQMSAFDLNKDGVVDFSEFEREGRAHDAEAFSHEAALEDFRLHDLNGDGSLDLKEFEHLLVGHHLLGDSIQQALKAADADGDGHIHIESEVPLGLGGLLDSEFVEDYFFHEHHDIRGHDEL